MKSGSKSELLFPSSKFVRDCRSTFTYCSGCRKISMKRFGISILTLIYLSFIGELDMQKKSLIKLYGFIAAKNFNDYSLQLLHCFPVFNVSLFGSLLQAEPRFNNKKIMTMIIK